MVDLNKHESDLYVYSVHMAIVNKEVNKKKKIRAETKLATKKYNFYDEDSI